MHRIESGEAQFMVELFRGFFVAMIVGILCVYAVLVLLFKRFLQPVTILSALPPSLGCAIVFLLLFGHSLSVPSLIGMLMLMGVVTKTQSCWSSMRSRPSTSRVCRARMRSTAEASS